MSQLEQLIRNFKNAGGVPYSGFIVEITDAKSGANVRLYTPEGVLVSNSGVTQTDTLGTMSVYVYVSGDRTYNLALYHPDSKARVDTFYETSPGTNQANPPNAITPGGAGAGAAVFTPDDIAFLSDYANFGMQPVSPADTPYGIASIAGYEGFAQPGDSGGSSILVRMGVGIVYDSANSASSLGFTGLSFNFSQLAARGIRFMGVFGTKGTYVLADGTDYINSVLEANWYGPYQQLTILYNVPRTLQPQGTPRSNHAWEMYATFSKAAI